jgi:hypothetical protein
MIGFSAVLFIKGARECQSEVASHSHLIRMVLKGEYSRVLTLREGFDLD